MYTGIYVAGFNILLNFFFFSFLGLNLKVRKSPDDPGFCK